MGKVTITYSKIKDAAKEAQSAANYYEDFSSELSNKVYNKLSISYGSDSRGYISSARNTVYNKVKDLNSKKKKYSDLSKSLYDLKERVQGYETSAKNAVTRIATDELELKNRKWYQKVGDWIYGTICVDFLNSNPITRGLGNIIKSGLDYFDYGFDKAIDWFKHGNGKYVLNIALSVLGVVAAIAGTIGAIALCVATGGAAVPLLVAAIASTIGTIMTTVDSVVSIINNIKALNVASKGNCDPGRARYYGNISGVSSAIGKYDMGGKTANDVWNAFGIGYEVTHTAADITAIVAGSIGSAGLTETKVVDKAGRVSVEVKYDPNKVKMNYGNYIKEKFGFRQTNGKWKFDAKYAFGKDSKGTTKRIDILKSKATRDGMGYSYKQYKGYKKVLKVIKTPSKIKGYADNYEKIERVISGKDKINNIDDAYKKVIKPILKTTGDSGRIITSPIKVINDTVVKIVDTGIRVAS